MKKLILSAMLLALVACSNTAVVKQIQDSDACGKGITRLIPTEGEVWLVLCEDGRVMWMDEEDIE